MAIISGTLTDGTGQIINNCTIVLHAKRTTATVLNQTQAFNVASNGAYNMTVSPCDYDVLLLIDGFPPKKLGQIQVFSTSKNGTLNDFLLLPQTGQPITPAVLEQITDERVKAQAAAIAAKKSENNAASILTGAIKKSGDTMTGQLGIKSDSAGLWYENVAGQKWLSRIFNDGSYGLYTLGADGGLISKQRFISSLNLLRFENIDDLTILGKSALKQGDYGIGDTAPLVSDLNEIRQSLFCRTDNNTLNTPFSGVWSVTHINTGGNASSISPTATQLAVQYHASASVYTRSATGGKWNNWVQMISSANSTVDSNGVIRKASPILQLYGTDEIVSVDGFTKAGYGLVNNEAQGATAKRIGIGHYEIHGSLGFAKEGWYISLPEDANGNKKIFAEYLADENSVITIKTYTKKFDFEKCEVVAGEPIDITDGRWVDVRLEMPVVEIIEQEEPIPSTLNPIVSEVTE